MLRKDDLSVTKNFVKVMKLRTAPIVIITIPDPTQLILILLSLFFIAFHDAIHRL